MITSIIPKPLPGTCWGENKDSILRKLPLTHGFCPTKLTRIPENRCPCGEYRATLTCVCKLYEKITL